MHHPILRSFWGAAAALVLLVTAACGKDPVPGEFRAGFATVRSPAPLGIGTSGFNGIGVAAPPSRYSEFFPGTTRVHGHPNIKAVVLSRGPSFETVFVRLDQVAVIEQLRTAVVEEVKRRSGRDLDNALVIAATHTHSGPGRFIGGDFLWIMGDAFFPQYVDRLVGSIADAIEGAYADLAPAELGHAIANDSGGHNKRRCEDLSDYINSDIPVVAVKRGGRVEAVIAAYAVHATVLGISQLTLSQDVHGAVEEHLESLFEHPVTTVMFSSWAGDMSPASPPFPDETVALSAMPSGYERLERLGVYLASAIRGVVDGIETTSEPVIEARTHRYPIRRSIMGYQEGEFPFEFGGVYCGVSGASCEEDKRLDGADQNCLAFPSDEPAPMQVPTTVGRLGSLSFITWAGESSTSLAEWVLAKARQGDEPMMFVGYAGAYLGYQLLEEDWWQGGYEASGAMWGPKQGEYMGARVAEIAQHVLSGKALPFEEPSPERPFDTSEADEWVTEQAVEKGKVVTQPEGGYVANGVASVTVNGDDPWFGTPRAILQRGDGEGNFTDVLRPNGKPYDSDGYGYWVNLSTEPAWGARPIAPAPRQFRWNFNLALGRAVPVFEGATTGTFRFRVVLPGPSGETEVFSEAFDVTAE